MQQADGWQESWQDGLQDGWHDNQHGNRHDNWGDAPVNRRSPSENREAAFPDNLAALIHDARNMVSTMDLYCDLLEEPGVLFARFRHYADELRMVASASRRLLEKLAVAESGLASKSRIEPATSTAELLPESLARRGRRHMFQPGQEVQSLANELQANQNLLSALAGPAITVGMSISAGARRIAMTGDDLTRVLVNLVKNAAEAMPGRGHIQIELREDGGHLCLSITDNGPGIPEAAFEAIFMPGYSTHVGLGPVRDLGTESVPATPQNSGYSFWSNRSLGALPVRHRGLGLSIVRSIVSAAGGSVSASNGCNPAGRTVGEPTEIIASGDPDHRGAVIVVQFPRLDLPKDT